MNSMLNMWLANVMASSHGNRTASTGPKGTKYPFYILAGQSNTGNDDAFAITGSVTASYSGGLAIPNANIWNPNYPADNSHFNIMATGVNTMCRNSSWPSSSFGSEVSLFYNLNSASAAPRYMLKHGVVGTSLANDWNSRTPGLLWTQLNTYITTLVPQMVASGSLPVLKGFIWMQGESDSQDTGSANNYLQELKNFFADFKSLWASQVSAYNLPTSSNNFVTVIGRINAPDTGSYPYRATVRAAQVEYCSTASNNAVYINTDGYSLTQGDPVHYSVSGQLQFGLDQFQQIKTYYSSSGSF